jgi:L-ectoine synthase
VIVRHIDEVKNSPREVSAPNGNWISRRMVLAHDNMGFSFHETIIKSNTETEIWYKNHFEAVYCITGQGEIETLEDNKVYPIVPGTMYALDKHDRHLLRCTEEMRLICVFNPAVTGNEVHDSDGSYSLPEDLHE